METKLSVPITVAWVFKRLARSPLVLALLFCLSGAKLASADAIYNFSLPANGAVSAFSVQLRFADLLPPNGQFAFPLTAPAITSFSFTTPGLEPGSSFIGLQITPTTTLVGVFLQGSGPILLLTPVFPSDFFSFPRTPLATGTFASTSGTVFSSLTLADTTPDGTLTVATVPETSTALLLISGLAMAGVWRLRRPV